MKYILWNFQGQNLTQHDKDRRKDFCRKMIRRLARDQNLLQNIIFTDECAINLTGNISRKNFELYTTYRLSQKDRDIQIAVFFNTRGNVA